MAPNTPDPFPNQTGKPIWYDANMSPAPDCNTTGDRSSPTAATLREKPVNLHPGPSPKKRGGFGKSKFGRTRYPSHKNPPHLRGM